MKVLSLLGKRLLMLVGVVMGVTLITFSISRLIPGDAAQLMAGSHATPQVVASIRQQLGLDRPLMEQYAVYMKGLAQGDLGISFVTRRPVLEELGSVFPATVELMLYALLVAVVAGVTLGVIAAVYQNRWPDRLIRVVSIFGISVPPFWLGLLLLLIFYGGFGILPGDGRLHDFIDPPLGVTGFYTVDALLSSNWLALQSALLHLLLPVATLAFVLLGSFVRIVRTSMTEVLREDYIRTAVAGGLSRRTVIIHYALRNALIPFVTIVGLDLASLLFGSVVVESIFMWPGAGSYVLNAIFALDFNTIMGFTVVVSIAYVLINFVVDLIYMLIDPKIREEVL